MRTLSIIALLALTACTDPAFIWEPTNWKPQKYESNGQQFADIGYCFDANIGPCSPVAEFPKMPHYMIGQGVGNGGSIIGLLPDNMVQNGLGAIQKYPDNVNVDEQGRLVVGITTEVTH